MGKYVKANQIDSWFSAGNREGRAILPEVVYRLVLASIPAANRSLTRFLSLDAGELPGFDGHLITDITHPYVPKGESIWEIGTGDADRKIAFDAAKRVKDKTINIAETTIVFVSPHPWKNSRTTKEARQAEIKAEDGWKEVRIIDAVDLAQWLDSTPGTDRWLASMMGVPVHGLDTLFARWNVLLPELAPEAMQELSIGGRAPQMERVQGWLKSGKPLLIVIGETLSEVEAFVAASINALPEEEAKVYETLTTVLLAPEAAEHVEHIPVQRPIVVVSSEIYAERRDALKGVRVVIGDTTLVGKSTGTTEVVNLGMPNREALRKGLVTAGKAGHVANEIARNSKGSFTAIVWMLSTYPKLPEWAKGSVGAKLTTLLLLKQWQFSNSHDAEAAQKLSGMSVSDIDHLLSDWSVPKGPLLRRDETWDWVAIGYAWACLAPNLNDRVLQDFASLTKGILGEIDPSLELEPSQRWAAAVYGKRLEYSRWLRSSLVDSLGQLSLVEAATLPKAKTYVDGLVDFLLSGKETNREKMWLSLASELPDLAEASPDVFFKCLDDFLEDEKARASIFTEEGVIGNSSRHVHILWALERLAWNPAYLTKSVIALARLAEIDPGGKLSNRPMASLMEIFLSWGPHTEATPTQRLESIVALAAHHEEIAWKLALSLMPGQYDISNGTALPRLRPPVDERITVTGQDFWQMTNNLVTLLLNWAPKHKHRWAGLVATYDRLSKQIPDIAVRIGPALAALEPSQFTNEEREHLQDAARRILGHHRSYPDAQWAMSEEQLAPIAALYEHMAPTDPVTSSKWLFVSWPELPEARDEDVNTRFKEVDDLRREAIRKVIEQGGIKALSDLIDKVERPDEVGRIAFGVLDGNSEWQQYLKNALEIDPGSGRTPPPLAAAISYLWQSRLKDGYEKIEQLIEFAKFQGNANALANIGTALPPGIQSWKWLKEKSPEAEELYWKRALFFVPINPETDAAYAIDALFKAERYFRAIDVANMCMRKKKGSEQEVVDVSNEMLIKLLRTALQTDPLEEVGGPGLGMLGYHVGSLLDFLESRGAARSELAQLEFGWMNVLESGRRNLNALQAELAESPELFMQLINSVFRPKSVPKEDLPEPTPQERILGTQAYRVLRAFTWVPGSDTPGPKAGLGNGGIPFSSGNVDASKLNKWVDEVRDLAKKGDRLDVTDSLVGGMLAYSPEDSDGTWPTKPVRDLIERINSSSLESGISTGVINRRGAHFVAPEGAQEFSLSKRFDDLAKLVQGQWPRTAAVLRSLSENFSHEGNWHKRRDRFEEYQ